MSVTANMNLVLPTPTVTPGPEYATENNTAFSVIDSHNHTSGQGVPVPSAGLNINSDLTFQSNNAIALKSSRYTNQGSPLSGPSDLSCVYSSGAGGDLYYNDGVGNQIQLTVGGALNAASIGGIGGDYTTSTASVFYTSLNTTFTFWQASGINATLDIGDLIIREEVASAFGVSITSPTLSADYTLVLPTALPAQQSFMTLDAAGNIAAPWTVDNVTTKIVANQVVAVTGWMSESFKANGPYRVGTFVDEEIFFPYDATIIGVWVQSGTTGSSGITELDIKKTTVSGGTYASIFSTTPKIAATTAITSITRVSTTATATLANHGFINGETVTISGATQTQYNGSFVISNVATNTFDYTVAGSPATPATGSPVIKTKNNVYTDSNSVQAAQAGVTKPVISGGSITAGSALRFDIISAMVGAKDCAIIVQWTKNP